MNLRNLLLFGIFLRILFCRLHISRVTFNTLLVVVLFVVLTDNTQLEKVHCCIPFKILVLGYKQSHYLTYYYTCVSDSTKY